VVLSGDVRGGRLIKGNSLWEVIGGSLGILFVVALFGFWASEFYFDYKYPRDVLEQDYEIGPLEFGRFVAGQRDGWWFDVYPRRSYPARYRNRGGRTIFVGEAKVKAHARPRSIGRYVKGDKEGMWLHWKPTDAPPGRRVSLLEIDQNLTGRYQQNKKVGPFDEDYFEPYAQTWEWPPAFDILKTPGYLRFILIGSSLTEPFLHDWPDVDEIQLVGPYDEWWSLYEGIPWRCLSTGESGVMVIAKYHSCVPRGDPDKEAP